MKNLFLIMTAVGLGVIYLVGCGNDKKDAAQVNAACPAGSYYSNGLCYGISGSVQNAAYSYNNSFYAEKDSGSTSISFVDANKMREFFKLGMGLCDRGQKNYQNLGQNNCDYYLTGRMAIVIQLASGTPNNMLATFVAKPRENAYFNYAGSLPNGWDLLRGVVGYTTGVWVPDTTTYQGAGYEVLQIPMALSTYNNYAGFEGRGKGDNYTALNNTVLAIQVPTGKAEDPGFDFNFFVGGVKAATGRMARCPSNNCGL